MATIIPFRLSEERRSIGGGSAAGHSAEIVIFPGVRIERWVEDIPPYDADFDDEDEFLDPDEG